MLMRTLMRTGSVRSAHAAHYDAKHNMFVNVFGRKRFRLFRVRRLPL